MKDRKRVYASFAEIDRDLKLLRIQREIHKVCLKNDIYHIQKSLVFSKMMKETAKSLFSMRKGKWTTLVLSYIISKFTKR